MGTEYGATVGLKHKPPEMGQESGEYVLEPLAPGDDAPCDRFKHACASYDGYVYIHGGRHNGMLGDLWRYSVALGRWEELPGSPGAPDKLEGHSMVAHDGVLYVFGGLMDSGSNCETTPLWKYAIGPRKWFSGRSPEGKEKKPRNRKGHSAVVYQSSMYVYGGYFDISGVVDEFWGFYFDAEKWAELSPTTRGLGPGPRHGHSCVTHNSAMYLFGGLKQMTEQNDFWRFDFRRHNWSSIKTSSGPPKLVGHSSVTHEGCMWIIGGGLPYRSPAGNLWKYHFNSRTWKKVSPGKENSLHAKMYHSAVGVGPQSQPGLCDGASRHTADIRPFSDKSYFFHTKSTNKVANIPAGDVIELETMKKFPASPVFCACPFSGSEHSDEQRLLSNCENEAFTGETEEKGEDLPLVRAPGEDDQNICLIFGGKPLASGCGISVWRLKLG
ncbi:rab9 effector protein with kelch motifs-like isoform X2 [Spea bombifrons]|uniref:rab9 effector protein with kelch motifs-like isoform X2 n=1 Tax=Spea bombifrons TaxID=233779 RepID=UPI00234945B2|nr:rab9 effector protein with kelch motifs-like isoform X2 [Spea bombifrons]